jgi:hypothetical protein
MPIGPNEPQTFHHGLFDDYPPLNVWSWFEGANLVVIAQLDANTGLVWAVGEASEGSTDVFEEGLRSLLSRPNAELFWDLELLDRYAPKTRRMIVELLAAERKKLDRIHLLSDKAMIAMAASAVNLVLGGILQVHRDRQPWQDAARKRLGPPLGQSSASGSRPSISTAAGSTSSASLSQPSASSSAWRKRPEEPAPNDSGARWRKG